MPQPVTVFLRQSTMLKAAVAMCLHKTQPKPVHRLRSITRRIEATLELLTMSAEIADMRKRSRSLRRSLRKVRRAAGNVRDLDVHRELLRAYGKSSDSTHLDNELASARNKAANRLQRRLEKDEPRIHRALDDLEVALEPAHNLELSGGKLVNIARSWFTKANHDFDLQDDDQLHSIRKACKTARYLAEVGSEVSKTATNAATRFERAQQTLGVWHDHVLLLKKARASLGTDNELIEEMQADTERLRQCADLAVKRVIARI
jgi:CHAD domain-containing protein